ncbi:MAG: hypothetical protein ACRDOL_09870 [Streptosporangiaceae bacterium]
MTIPAQRCAIIGANIRAATGLGYPAARPPLARLVHIRAVLAARLWLQGPPRPGARDTPGGTLSGDCAPPSPCPPARAGGTCSNAEVHWPSIDASPYAGQTSEPAARPTGRAKYAEHLP